MKKETMVLSVLTLSAFILSGCLVTTKTYKLTKERVDQNLTAGNRGYLKGQPPAEEESKPRKTTRVTQVIEMEFGGQKSGKQASAAAEDHYSVPQEQETESYLHEEEDDDIPSAVSFREYKVQKNDTLQKISMKFYGTTRKWKKIYEANGGVLKGPNKIYPGQTIRIPEEGIQLLETGENLK